MSRTDSTEKNSYESDERPAPLRLGNGSSVVDKEEVFTFPSQSNEQEGCATVPPNFMSRKY